jgi:hypothetical protein
MTCCPIASCASKCHRMPQCSACDLYPFSCLHVRWCLYHTCIFSWYWHTRAWEFAFASARPVAKASPCGWLPYVHTYVLTARASSDRLDCPHDIIERAVPLGRCMPGTYVFGLWVSSIVQSYIGLRFQKVSIGATPSKRNLGGRNEWPMQGQSR